MKAIEFEEQNIVFAKPPGMTDEECGPLPAYRGEGQIISCWQVTPEDLERIQETGVIWLGVAGTGQPPVWLDTQYPFVTE